MPDLQNRIFATITYMGTVATGLLKSLPIINDIIVILVGLATLTSSLVWVWYTIQKNQREKRGMKK